LRARQESLYHRSMGTEAQQLLEQQGQLRDRWAAIDPILLHRLRGLRLAERALMERFGAPLQGRVLVLGCRAGRFTAQLYRIAHELHGGCEAAEDLLRCRRQYPHAVFTACQPRELCDFQAGAFDAVLVPGEVLDALDDVARRGALHDVRALLAQDGLLIFSSRNRDCALGSAGWGRVLPGLPRHPLPTALRMGLRVRNRRRLGAQERRARDCELRSGEGREFGAVHYSITREAQERQLSELGYELLECLDLEGRSVARSASAERSRQLFYVARP
jgi:SAM-dependent methyltransferase